MLRGSQAILSAQPLWTTLALTFLTVMFEQNMQQADARLIPVALDQLQLTATVQTAKGVTSIGISSANYVVWQLVVIDEHDPILGWLENVGGASSNDSRQDLG